jgi:hypothetical protein
MAAHQRKWCQVANSKDSTYDETPVLAAGVCTYGYFFRHGLHGRTNPHLNLMIRKLKSGEFRLYSRKKDAKTGKRKNMGTFSSLAAAKKHERAVQYFKRAG